MFRVVLFVCKLHYTHILGVSKQSVAGCLAWSGLLGHLSRRTTKMNTITHVCLQANKMQCWHLEDGVILYEQGLF